MRPHSSNSQPIVSILKADIFLGNGRLAETGTKPSLPACHLNDGFRQERTLQRRTGAIFDFLTLAD